MNNSLQTLDIFTLLGIQGTEEEKEAFLEDLQDVIWEEVVDSELADSLSETDLDAIEATLSDDSLSMDDKRNTLYGMLSEKIPNLNEVLADKTMQLKGELFTERLAGMREYYTKNNKPQELQVMDEADRLAQAGEYQSAVEMVNKLQIAAE